MLPNLKLRLESESQCWSLFTETEGYITAIQDQIITSRTCRRRILKIVMGNGRCSMCNEKVEFLNYVVARCTILAPKMYLDRNNRVAKIVSLAIRNIQSHEEDITLWKHESISICEDDEYKLYCRSL